MIKNPKLSRHAEENMTEKQRQKLKNPELSRNAKENITPERLLKKNTSARIYAQSERGKLLAEVNRASNLAAKYRFKDKKKGLENDIDGAFISANILGHPCIYCGCAERTGCDRIDNSKGHLKDNVVPSCRDCNVVRGNRYTCEEMKAVGPLLKQIRDSKIKGI